MPVACEGNDVGVVWVQGRAPQNGSMQFDFRKEFFFESFHQHQIKRLQIEFWQQFLQRGFARVFWQFRNQGMVLAGSRSAESAVATKETVASPRIHAQ